MLIQANNHVQTQENKYQYKDITTSYGMWNDLVQPAAVQTDEDRWHGIHSSAILGLYRKDNV